MTMLKFGVAHRFDACRGEVRRNVSTYLVVVIIVLAVVASFATLKAFGQSVQAGSPKIVGPNSCVECHKDEGSIWKKTHHFTTFRKMPRNKKSRKIARRLGIKRVKAEKLCLGCHFTQEKVRNKKRVTAGISCESCHGAGKDWEKTHSEFSGNKNKEQESKAQAAKRWKLSEKQGLIRPKNLYKLAKNCYGCHVVPNEKLVNVGKHEAGSKFELLSWSQGEVRHNVWYTKGKSNKQAKAKRRRMLYLAGVAVELETALRAVALATKKKKYAVRMAHRADRARKKMAAVAKAAGNVPELRKIVKLGHSAGLKLNNKKALTRAANSIAKVTKSFLAKHDGSKLGGIDKFLPKPKDYKGTPSK